MAFYRQLLVLTVPSVAVLFGIYWYRRKRGCANSDPGGNTKSTKTLRQELEEAASSSPGVRAAGRVSPTVVACSPAKPLLKSAPIDILPNGINSQRSSPLQLTDKQLDLEIEKAKSQKFYEMEYPLKRNSKENTPPTPGERRSGKSSPAKTTSPPIKEINENSDQSVSVKQESVIISCLADKINNSKNRDNIEEGSSDRLTCDQRSKSISPVKEIQEVMQSEKASQLTNKSSKRTRKQAKKQSALAMDLSAKSDNASAAKDEDEEQKKDVGVEAEALTRVAERDSANHSPVDAMMASPSISNFSDNHSEGSSDSGKGCSESPSPPPTSVGDAASSPGPLSARRHQFLVPQAVVGMIIGARRSFLNKMNETTCAKVYIRTHPDTSKLKICVIEGCQRDIDTLLDMIRVRLPESRFPNISLKDITAELCEREFTLMSECYHLSLVEGVNNDSIVSCYVSPSQLFLQQPTHPTYPSLHILHTLMGVCYQDPSVPSLPQHVTHGMICAAPTANNWYRTEVVSTNEETNCSYVKLVDFGGFMNVSNSLLKQIRVDFMMLPFQATEVQLANVIPPQGGEWSPEAVQVMAGLTSGQLLQAQVVGYTDTGLPQVYLYLTLGPQQVISLNQELVVRGLAEWVEQDQEGEAAWTSSPPHTPHTSLVSPPT